MSRFRQGRFRSEFMQIDPICDAFERDWRARRQPKVEDFLCNVAAELRDELLYELIATEVDLRRECGELASEHEYLKRFPEQQHVVRSIFAGDSTPLTPPKIDRYEVERVLGSGEFGIVYLAYDPQLDRHVAVKVPRPERLGTREELQRLVDEAKHAAKLDHPGIVRVYDANCTAIPHLLSNNMWKDNAWVTRKKNALNPGELPSSLPPLPRPSPAHIDRDCSTAT